MSANIVEAVPDYSQQLFWIEQDSAIIVYLEPTFPFCK